MNDADSHPACDQAFDQARSAFMAGLACFQAGQLEQAVQHYRLSLQHWPGRPSTLINLAAALLRLGQAGEALACADAALAVEGDSVEALLHRACAQARLGQAAPALASFQRLTTLAPQHAAAWSAYGSLLRELQRNEEAARALTQALRLGADPELHHYYLAALGAEAAPPGPPRAYVEALFDAYAEDFDQHLVGTLGYCAPEELVARVRRCAGAASFNAVLDLGCGTGLCGPLLRPLLSTPFGTQTSGLTGLDLSAAMLSRARERGVYDRLVHDDAVQFLVDCGNDNNNGSDSGFDLVVAADVLIYIGDPAPLLAAARRAMQQGLLAFTVELADTLPTAATGGDGDGDGDGKTSWQLLPSLRYAHHPAALLQLARAHGFEPVLVESAPVRHDQGRPVPGLYLVLRREVGTAVGELIGSGLAMPPPAAGPISSLRDSGAGR
jgi:predicted TPR repeat methyltransferase